MRASALCSAIILTLSLSACAMQTTSNFDSDAWKSQRGVGARENQRGPMVSTVEKAVQTGMSREDVVRLLGEPDSSDDASATDVYELGVARYGIDEEFYEITYQDGKVASHRWGRR
jgi:outer membrane protein assembly factor BamE (lipoprotein component of BamABCDE complex)